MKQKVLIISGNPCASYFYKEWQKEILEIDNNLEVIIGTFPEYCSELPADEYLDKVTNYFEELLNSFQQKGRVIIIGHSIGGFFGLKLLQRIEERIKQLILIFPFLGSPEKEGIRILRFAKLISKLKPISRLIVRNKNLLIPFSSDVRFITSDELSSSITLARKEYDYFKNYELSPQSLRETKVSKIKFLYNKKDIWCSDKIKSLLKSHVNSSFVSLDHDFIIHSNQRSNMTDMIINIISHNNQK